MEDMNEEIIETVQSGYVPAPEGFLYANVDENHKLILMNQIDAFNQGLPAVEFEQGYDNNLYEKGYAPEKPAPTYEEIDQMRIQYRRDHIDDKTIARARKQANNTWTDQDEAGYLALDAEVTAYIEEHFPYPETQE